MSECKYLISSCLIGINCNYKGSNTYIKELKELVQNGEAIVACPEVLGGLPVPRKSCEITKNTDDCVKVENTDGEDVTEQFIKGANKTLKIAQENNIKIAIMQPRSPSCGCGKIYDGTFSKTMISGDGITVTTLKKHGIKVLTPEQFLTNMEQ